MGKLAVVTGASGDIGSEICRSLAFDGYDICAQYSSAQKAAEKLCADIEQTYGVKAYSFKADFRKSEETQAFAEFAKGKGDIHVLINNAGISYQGLFQDVPSEKVQEIFSINLLSAMLLTQRILPCMIKKHSGKIVNISSMWGITGGSCEVHYSASKAALIGFTKALSKEVGTSSITVNCVAPGFIDTKMNAAFSKEDIDIIKDDTPLNKIGSPKDVASAVSFLCSDAASFITGQVLACDGGITT